MVKASINLFPVGTLHVSARREQTGPNHRPCNGTLRSSGHHRNHGHNAAENVLSKLTCGVFNSGVGKQGAALVSLSVRKETVAAKASHTSTEISDGSAVDVDHVVGSIHHTINKRRILPLLA